MSIKISHNTNTGHWHFSYKRHVLNALGVPLVLSGFASFSSPWWLGIAVSILEKINVNVQDDYQWAIGLSQIIFGSTLIVFKYFILDKRIKEKETDKNSLINSKILFQSISAYLDQLVDDHSYNSSMDSKFHESYTYFDKPENELQYKKTKKLYNAYAKASALQHVFISQNFCVFPKNQTSTDDYRYCLSPHYNIDRDLLSGDTEKMKKYNEQAEELSRLVGTTKSTLNNFISHLKSIGSV